MTTKSMWYQHCKMTCLGGSERGTCGCPTPEACELAQHPNYQVKRGEALERMVQLVKELWEIDLERMATNPCRCKPKCSFSTGFDGSLMRGSGDLNEYGFWQYPCPAWEIET